MANLQPLQNPSATPPVSPAPASTPTSTPAPTPAPSPMPAQANGENPPVRPTVPKNSKRSAQILINSLKRSWYVIIIVAVLLVAGILLLTLPRPARTIYVDSRETREEFVLTGSPGKPFSKIQAAIDKAVDGDIIHIRAGIYQETLKLDGVSVTLEGEGVEKTMLISVTQTSDDPQKQTAPTTTGDTGQISSRGPDAAVKELPYESNDVVTYLNGATGVLQNLTIVGSKNIRSAITDEERTNADYEETALYESTIGVRESAPILRNLVLSGGAAGVEIINGAPTIENIQTYQNSNAGLIVFRSAGRDVAPAVLINSIIYNAANYGVITNDAEAINLSYNNIFGSGIGNTQGSAESVLNEGTGALSVNPLFARRQLYRLDHEVEEDSPAVSMLIDAGAPDAQYNDVDGSRNDMGAFGGPHAIFDANAPGQITDLTVAAAGHGRILLTWTAPADPETSDAVAGYEVRTLLAAITEDNIDEAFMAKTPTDLVIAGTVQTLILTDLKSLARDVSARDADYDGLQDYYETVVYGTDPNKRDTDEDGRTDKEEIESGSDPFVKDEAGDKAFDSDKDGIPDWQEQKMYRTNPYREDTDDDGTPDLVEIEQGSDPTQHGTSVFDTDGDGLSDYLERIVYRTKIKEKDTDGDGIDDKIEIERREDPLHLGRTSSDTDGDGLSDYQEVVIYKTDPTRADTDGDGTDDKAEIDNGRNPLAQDEVFLDSDKDGLSDYAEKYIYKTDPTRADTDGDGVDDKTEVDNGRNPLHKPGDALDSDGDGLSDYLEIVVYGTNPANADTDADGVTDAREIELWRDPLEMDNAPNDPDGDGLINYYEKLYGTNPNVADTDGDGMDDFTEIRTGRDPLVSEDGMARDVDGDGLADYLEVNLYKTDPAKADTDDDGTDDKTEINGRRDPLTPLGEEGNKDYDGDGLSDYSEIVIYKTNCQKADTDRDGVSDREEIEQGRDPVVLHFFAVRAYDTVMNLAKISNLVWAITW